MSTKIFAFYFRIKVVKQIIDLQKRSQNFDIIKFISHVQKGKKERKTKKSEKRKDAKM